MTTPPLRDPPPPLSRFFGLAQRVALAFVANALVEYLRERLNAAEFEAVRPELELLLRRPIMPKVVEL